MNTTGKRLLALMQRQPFWTPTSQPAPVNPLPVALEARPTLLTDDVELPAHPGLPDEDLPPLAAPDVPAYPTPTANLEIPPARTVPHRQFRQSGTRVRQSAPVGPLRAQTPAPANPFDWQARTGPQVKLSPALSDPTWKTAWQSPYSGAQLRQMGNRPLPVTERTPEQFQAELTVQREREQQRQAALLAEGRKLTGAKGAAERLARSAGNAVASIGAGVLAAPYETLKRNDPANALGMAGGYGEMVEGAQQTLADEATRLSGVPETGADKYVQMGANVAGQVLPQIPLAAITGGASPVAMAGMAAAQDIGQGRVGDAAVDALWAGLGAKAGQLAETVAGPIAQRFSSPVGQQLAGRAITGAAGGAMGGIESYARGQNADEALANVAGNALADALLYGGPRRAKAPQTNEAPRLVGRPSAPPVTAELNAVPDTAPLTPPAEPAASQPRLRASIPDGLELRDADETELWNLLTSEQPISEAPVTAPLRTQPATSEPASTVEQRNAGFNPFEEIPKVIDRLSNLGTPEKYKLPADRKALAEFVWEMGRPYRNHAKTLAERAEMPDQQLADRLLGAMQQMEDAHGAGDQKAYVAGLKALEKTYADFKMPQPQFPSLKAAPRKTAPPASEPVRWLNDLREVVSVGQREGKINAAKAREVLDIAKAGRDALQRGDGAEYIRWRESAVEALGAKPGLKEKVMDLANVPRSLLSSIDLSYPFRQGAIGMLNLRNLTPERAKQRLSEFDQMLKAAVSQRNYDDIRAEIRSHPSYQLGEESGLYLSTQNALKINKSLLDREESFASKLAERLPLIGRGVKVSERAYTAAADLQRIHLFDGFAKQLERAGVTPDVDPQSYRDIASFVNKMTGRGSIPEKLESLQPVLNGALFSPRFLASRLQVLNPATYAQMAPAARKIALQEVAGFLSAFATVAGLAAANGLDVGTNPDDSDFGKIRYDNTRYDLLGGLQQPVVFLYRMGHALYAKHSGERLPASRQPGAVTERFLRTKASPAAGYAYDWFVKNSRFNGYWDEKKPFSHKEALPDLITPLFVRDLAEAYQSEGMDGIFKTMPGMFGVGVQTYELRQPNGKAPAKTKRTRPMRVRTVQE